MIITCPDCDAQYKAPDTAIPSEGRKLKCTACGFVWLYAPADVEDDTLAPVEDIPQGIMPRDEDEEAAPEESAVEPSAKEHKKGGKKGVVAGILVGLVLILPFFLMRSEMVRLWPPAAGVFDRLGLHYTVAGERLIFDMLQARVDEASGEKILTISGKIINLTSEVQAMPPVLVDVKSGEGISLASFQISFEEKSLEAEESLPFIGKFPYNFPEGEVTATVRFGI